MIGPILAIKADELASHLGKLDHFKKRHNIGFKGLCSEMQSVDEESDESGKS